MTTEALFTQVDKDLQKEVQAFASSIPRQLLLDMDAGDLWCILWLCGTKFHYRLLPPLA